MADFGLNPALDVDAISQSYRSNGLVRIEPLFSEPAAAALHHHLSNELEWVRVVNHGEKTFDLGREAVAAAERDPVNALIAGVHANARHGFQFLFDSVRVSDDDRERVARGLLLDRLAQSLNNDAMLAFFRQIISDDRVSFVDAQATRYLPGHFLTSHDDDVAGKGRLAAYIISLNPEWRTDWGGLLQMIDANGDVTRALLPRYNAVHIFKVPQLHNVSLVAPFAGAPRYSITGWLRTSA